MGNYLKLAKEIFAKHQPSFFDVQSVTAPTDMAVVNGADNQAPIQIPSELITTAERLATWISKQLANDDRITIDLETSGLTFAKDFIYGIAINCGNKNVYVALRSENQCHIPLPEAKRILNPLFNSDRPKIFHNATFDLPFLMIHGFQVSGPFYDTRLIAREFHGREQRSYALKELACHHVHQQRSLG